MLKSDKEKVIEIINKHLPHERAIVQGFTDGLEETIRKINELPVKEELVEIKDLTVTLSVSEYVENCMNYYNKGRQDEIDKMDWRI